MGLYRLNSQEIADVFEQLEFESHCEGDFDEDGFIEGAKKYIKYLRSIGADIQKSEMVSIPKSIHKDLIKESIELHKLKGG